MTFGGLEVAGSDAIEGLVSLLADGTAGGGDE